MRNLFGFHFLLKKQNLSALKDQQTNPNSTVVYIDSAQQPKNLTPAKQHMNLTKMEERRRHLQAMYFSS